MSNILISNSDLCVTVSTDGAEMTSIRSAVSGVEYLWQGDPKFWKRHAPVLFPIVGSLWEGRYRLSGKEYELRQHGFARDMAFDVVRQDGHSVELKLDSTPDTLKLYPFPFELTAVYRIQGKDLHVAYAVHNPSATSDMFFQLGAHPAFCYQGFSPSDGVHGYFKMDGSGISYRMIGDKSCLDESSSCILHTDADGMLPLTNEVFANDALVIEGGQIHRVTLLDRHKRPVLTLQSQAPVFGLWSPAGKNAPFVCIEPWHGRCDAEHFTGEFPDKAWVNKLSPSGTFTFEYIISIC